MKQSKDKRTMFIVMAICKWKDLEVAAVPGLQISPAFEGIGYLPVFLSEKKARKEFPDFKIVKFDSDYWHGEAKP